MLKTGVHLQSQISTPDPVQPLPTGMPAGTRRLSKRQKAAIVVRLLRAEGMSLSLADLPDNLQIALTEDMSVMRYIDRTTLRAVVDEFLAELDSIGLSFPGGMTGALAVLDGTISTATAARMRQQAGLHDTTDPWTRLAELDTERLSPILLEESVEIGAIVLSKLKVSKAAELLGLMPGERARRIAYAMSQTGAVAPATVGRIGAALVLQLDAQAPRAFEAAPVERVGAILNYSPAATRDEVLEGLDAEDQGFANQVRRAIFTFANIPDRIEPRDVPKITREVDAAILITALAFALANEAEAAAAEFVLSNMSQRMAAQLRDEIESMGMVKPREGEPALSAVIIAIRELEASGTILLVTEEE